MPALQRPPDGTGLKRHTTAPSVSTVNGHFASASGPAPTKEEYARGIQVIDEEKHFK